MFDTELFLAFLISPEYENRLNNVPKALKDMFIGNESYLIWREYEGNRYLGKPLGESLHEEDLKNASQHICSILQKIVPSFVVTPQSLILLAQLKHPL